MDLKITTVLVAFSTFTSISAYNCINEHGRTKCSQFTAPLEDNESINFPEYLPKFELYNYTGPLKKSTFQNVPDISQLSLNKCDISFIEEEVFCSLPKLKYIYISDSTLPNITTKTFGTCCHLLHTLGIQKTVIKDIAAGSFQYLNQLDTLLIQYTPLEILRNDVFKGLSQLQHLHLKRNQIKIIEQGAFNDLHNLKILNLSDNKLENISLEEFKRLASLEDLYLSSNQIKDLDVRQMLTYLNKLQFFSFFLNKMTCERLTEVADILKERKIGKQVFQIECLQNTTV